MKDTFEKARIIVRKHYRLTRKPTDDEVRAEIKMIQRKANDGDLCCLTTPLYGKFATLGVVT